MKNEIQRIGIIIVIISLVSIAMMIANRDENNYNNIENGVTIVSKEVPKIALISLAKAASPEKSRND